jgi:hypothetical protein
VALEDDNDKQSVDVFRNPSGGLETLAYSKEATDRDHRGGPQLTFEFANGHVVATDTYQYADGTSIGSNLASATLFDGRRLAGFDGGPAAEMIVKDLESAQTVVEEANKIPGK